MDSVVDDWRFGGTALLTGLRRVDGESPTLVPALKGGGDAGDGVEGRLLRTSDADALDDYEGVDAAWPGEGSPAERVRRYVDDRSAMVRPARKERDEVGGSGETRSAAVASRCVGQHRAPAGYVTC